MKNRAGLRRDQDAAVGIFLLLKATNPSERIELEDLMGAARGGHKESVPGRYFFTTGPLKPHALAAYFLEVIRRILRLQRPPQLIVFIDGIGHYTRPYWRKSRVLQERRLTGIRAGVFSVAWEIRRILIRVLERLGVAEPVDIWLEIARRGVAVPEGWLPEKRRVWIGQPIVEDFDLNEESIRALLSAIRLQGAEAYIPHPRSRWHPPVPVIAAANGDAPAELIVLENKMTAVGFCSSTLFNLEMIGWCVEYAEIPESLDRLVQHAEELRRAQARRLELLRLEGRQLIDRETPTPV